MRLLEQVNLQAATRAKLTRSSVKQANSPA